MIQLKLESLCGATVRVLLAGEFPLLGLVQDIKYRHDANIKQEVELAPVYTDGFER
jgi:hypothetical protein